MLAAVVAVVAVVAVCTARGDVERARLRGGAAGRAACARARAAAARLGHAARAGVRARTRGRGRQAAGEVPREACARVLVLARGAAELREHLLREALDLGGTQLVRAHAGLGGTGTHREKKEGGDGCAHSTRKRRGEGGEVQCRHGRGTQLGERVLSVAGGAGAAVKVKAQAVGWEEHARGQASGRVVGQECARVQAGTLPKKRNRKDLLFFSRSSF